MSDQWSEQRATLTEATREMYRRGLVGGVFGQHQPALDRLGRR